MDLEELKAKQRAIAQMAERMGREKDPDEILRMAEQIQAKAKELEKGALALAASVTPQPANVGGELRIVLTKDQRQRVTEQTGVGLETLVLEGAEAAAWELRMESMQKHIVEQRALQVAANNIAKAAMDKTVKQMLEELEAIPDPPDEIREAIKVLREEGQPGMEKLAQRQLAREAARKAQQQG